MFWWCVTRTSFERELVGQVGHQVHLVGRGIARRAAVRLQRDVDDGVARHLVLHQVGAGPARELRILQLRGLERRIDVGQRLVGRRREIAMDALDLGLRQVQRAVLDLLPLLFDHRRELVAAGRLDQDLDARLVDVVAPAEQVVDPEDRLEIREQMLLGQELAAHHADDRRAPEAAADPDLEPDLARLVLHDADADVVHADRGAVVRRAGDRDLELARQVGEFRVEGRPLPHDLRPDARILDLVGGDAGELVGGHVADAVAAGLDGVHLDVGQMLQDVRHVGQLRPVELDVLARGEVAEAAVVAPRDVGQLAHLLGRQHAIGHGDAQHVGVQLQIEAVLQAQRAELVLGQLAGDAARDLAAELIDPLLDDGGVEFVVTIHALLNLQSGRSTSPGRARRSACGRRGSARARRWASGRLR